MFKNITLENFFSFGKPTTLALNTKVNVLVGINGSGKSNFLKAIYLLSEAIEDKGFKNVFLGKWGGFVNVPHFGGNKEEICLTYEFDKQIFKHKSFEKYNNNVHYEIKIKAIGNSMYYLNELITVKNKTTNEIEKLLISENDEISFLNQKENSSEVYETFHTNDKTELALQIVENLEKHPILFELKKIIESLKFYDRFDTSSNSKLRQYASFSIEKSLNQNGDNLITLLNNFDCEEIEVFDKIAEYLEKINPHFRDFKFNYFGSKILLALREKCLNRTIIFEQISDGTLQYLLLLSIFLNPERGSVVCIDTPEIGLHPDMIHAISELISYASENTQMIITTHSPTLLNIFELNSLRVFEKDDKNETIISHKSENDLPATANNQTLGDLWVGGLLGGKRW